MATEEEQISLACPGRACRARVQWWRGSELIDGEPAEKSGGWGPSGFAEWTCGYCGFSVTGPSPLQQALDRLPVSNLPG